jgi:hypothetical protein
VVSDAQQNVNRVIESICLVPIKQGSNQQQMSEIERETLHVNKEYGIEIDEYQRELEVEA